jgi:hypothetical protein
VGQRAVFQPLIAPIVVLILGADAAFDLIPRQGVIRGGVLPPCEVDLRSPNIAQKFRLDGARLSKAKQNGLANIYFNPCITLSTRYELAGDHLCLKRLFFKILFTVFCSVRIEVLRALANRVTSSQQTAYCLSNGPRPKLSVGPSAGYPGRRTSLFYTDAIKRFGHLLEDKYLDRAYDRAKVFFQGIVSLTLRVLT